MDSAEETLSYFGGSIQGYPPVFSTRGQYPMLDNFEVNQYNLESLRPPAEKFCILFNVRNIQPHEIEVILKKDILNVTAKHERRQNDDGLWMTRNFAYTYELTPDAADKEIRAEWYEDGYLLIQATDTKSEVRDSEEIKLVPKQTKKVLKPAVEVQIVKKFIEGIRDKANYALRYFDFRNLSS